MKRRGMACVALGLVAASTLLGGSATAQEEVVETSLAGYQGKAAASGVHVFYNPEGALPLGSLVDIGAPDALATIAGGPTTFARAGVLDPGDIIANPDAVLALGSPDYPAGTIPPYPYRITANSGVGEPKAESTPAPGLSAVVEALPSGSMARATTPVAAAPGLITVGSMKALATTTIDESTVSVHARTELGRIEILGVLEIESLVTDVVATSDGGTPKLTGGTTVVGATLADQPVEIGADGLEGAKALTKALADAGVRITLLSPVELAGGKAGQLASTGLRIELEVSERTAPFLSQLGDALPPLDGPIPGAPGPEDVVALLQARHITRLELGQAGVQLSASKATPLPDFAIDTGAGAIDAGLATGSLDVPTGVVPSVTGPTLNGAPAAIEGTPVASVGAGIGALALLALLVQPLIGTRLARGVAAILGDDAADTCLREER